MKTGDAVVQAAPVVEAAVQAPAEVMPVAVDGAPAVRSPFELLPVGEAFGVCSVDGVCS
ncbi:hypothetical protein [Promicromonospora sp. NPDC050262]|uniref:hypothetical protein n=1 Tax=Promicromonospora sp. NPDC050262 TaxID=3155036 RepID=UPI0033CEF866